MAVSAKKKTSNKATTQAVRPKAVPDRKKIHRVGSHVNNDPSSLDTIGKRMTQRRLELRLTQEQIANQVVFTPRSGAKSKDSVILSRNAYCLYETGGVEPDLLKIMGIAKALDVSPEWLAFGRGERKQVDELYFDSKTTSFKAASSWIISEEWLRDHFGLNPSDVVLTVISEYSQNFVPGDIAIVRKDSEPSITGSEFVFGYKGTVRNAQVTRVSRTDTLRVFSTDLKTHEEIPLKSTTILGKVIGKISSTER